MKVLQVALLGMLGALLVPAPAAIGHSGGLDGCGCHAGSRPYHCHRNPCRYCPGSFNCKGRIKIVALPRARVFVDGEDMGLSPTRTFKAQDGSVQVRLEHRILGTAQFSVRVDYGTTTVHTLRW